jgi:sporulation protein YlmC with PRC-barrel domain
MMHGGQDIRASKLQGAQVKSAAGENLGTIEDVILNPRSGRIEFAVLSLTGPTGTTPTGAGEKLTPLPWKLLSFSSSGAAGAEQYSFTANVDQTKLTAAPSFDKNQWPDMSSHEWTQKYYSYFGITPGGMGGTGTGMEKEKGGTGTGTEKESGSKF